MQIDISLAELKSKNIKNNNKIIGLCHGCFDIIHFGHIKYLETAKSLGDILILGLNSDKSVSSLKGDQRPINIQGDRAYILAALEAVDYVVIFEEETPYKLIKEVKPNILVKGSDYSGREVAGEDLVEELVLVEFIEG